MDSGRDITGGRAAGREPVLAAAVRAARPSAGRTTAAPSPWSAQGATTEWFVPLVPPVPPAEPSPPRPRETPVTRGHGRWAWAAVGALVLAAGAIVGVLLAPGGGSAGAADPAARLVARAAGPWANHYALAGSYADYELTVSGNRWRLTGEDYVLA